eukprot:64312_1
MGSLHCYLSFILSIILSYAAEFNLTDTQTQWSSKEIITSGTHMLKGIATIPDMFIKPTTQQQRRLEEKTLSPTPPQTPAPTTKLMLPVIILIHPEGAQDRSLSIYGSQFDMNHFYQAKLFEDLKTKLVSKGKMAVIQYDKRNCKSPQLIGYNDDLNTYLGPNPLCEDPCPKFCSTKNPYENTCNLVGICYNDSNITVNNIIQDAKHIFTQSINEIKPYLDEEVVDFNRIWSIPIGFSSQGAAIATYIASTVNTNYNIWPTVISLMGSGIPIDQLLQLQLKQRLNNMKNNSISHTNEMVNILKSKFEMIKNGSFVENDTVVIDNNFLDINDTKYVSYWRDWLDLFINTEYEEIINFMSINSYNDELIPAAAYEPLRNMFASNATVEMNVLQNINHYMIDKKDWEHGKWIIDEKISEHIINFLNDVSGYLDDINEWIILNDTNNTNFNEHILVENDTIYKVLLYMAIMTIILILALGMYCIIARKACPYEFEDVNIENEARDDERERERERRRRRRRRHRRHRRSSHRNSNYRNMVELNEPMIQSALGNALLNDQNGNDVQENNNIEENVVNDQQENHATQVQSSILNEYVD